MRADSSPESETPDGRQRLLRRVAGILECPRCEVRLEDAPAGQPQRLICSQCGFEGRRSQDQFLFHGLSDGVVRQDWLNRLKESVKKRWGRFYPLAIRMLSSVYTSDFVEKFLGSFDTKRELVADLGSGTSEYGDRVVCVDGRRYDGVHVVADLERTVFASDSFDGLISIAVLEHVPEPARHVAEMRRILKPGGRVLCYIPFMQGYHASPHDYQRYTIRGIRHLFEDFEILDVGVGAGPTSGMLWVLQEWLAMVFSLGSKRLYRLLIPATWILSPIKVLDALLIHHPAAATIASGFFVEARKRDDG